MPDSATPSFTRRLLRWGGVLLLAATLLVAVGLGVWVLVVPGEIERRVVSMLNERGWPGSQVHVDRITTTGATLRDIVIGAEGRLNIDSVHITYTPGQLRAGNIEAATIRGAVLRATVQPDGSLDLGDLTNLRLPDDPRDGWPLTQLHIANSTIVLTTPERTYRLPIAGEITFGPAVQVNLRSEMFDRTLAVAAAVDTDDGVHLRDGRLQLSPGNLLLPGTDVILEQLAVDLRFEMEVVQNFELLVLPGSRLSIDGLGGDLNGYELTTGPGQTMATVEVQESIRMTMPADATGGMHAQIGRMMLRADEVAIVDPSGAAAEGVALELPITGRVGAGGLTLHLAEAGRFAAAHLRGPDVDAALGQWRLPRDETEPMLTWHDGRWAGQLRAEAEQSLTANLGGATVQAGRAAVDLVARFDDRLTYLLNLSLADAQARFGEVRIQGLELNLPVTGGVEEDPGVISIAAISIGELQLPGFTGQVAMTDGVLKAGGSWPVTPDLVATLGLELAGDTGQASVAVPPTVVADPQTFARFVPALAGIDIDGIFAVDGQLRITDGRIDPRLGISLNNVGIRAADLGLALDNLAGEITFDSLMPLVTPMRQKLTADSVTFGQLTFTDVVMWWQAEAATKFLIEELRWRLGERGRFVAFAIPIDLENPVIRTEVFVEHLNLDDWVAVLTGERVQATGELFGRIPITFDPSGEELLKFEPGFLYSEPGKGTLRFEDPQTVAQVLQQAGGAGLEGAAREVRDRTVQALTDFEYDMMKFDFIPENGDVMLRVQTRGRGRQANPVPIGNLTVNVRGFQEAVNAYLGFNNWVDRMKKPALNQRQ